MKSLMHVLGSRGDTETRWDPQDAGSVSRAREVFEGYRQEGYLTFSVSEPGAEADHVRHFDPAAHEIIVTRPLRGG